MNNQNHPKKGSIITVGPIKPLAAIAWIKEMLAAWPRDFALFVVGINTCLRGGDLLRLTVGQVRRLRVGDALLIREGKTGKRKMILINQAVFTATQQWLAARPPCEDDDALFPNYRTGKSLTVSTLNNMVKKWCREAGLAGNYGSHSLRKTFGFHQRITHNTDIPTLMVLYGHATQRQTLAYLGISEDEIKTAYMHEL